jgi:hypothetical protein
VLPVPIGALTTEVKSAVEACTTVALVPPALPASFAAKTISFPMLMARIGPLTRLLAPMVVIVPATEWAPVIDTVLTRPPESATTTRCRLKSSTGLFKANVA